jgi:hypothetical protein
MKNPLCNIKSVITGSYKAIARAGAGSGARARAGAGVDILILIFKFLIKRSKYKKQSE